MSRLLLLGAAALALAVSGCATVDNTVNGVLGGLSSAPTSAAEERSYAATEGVAVHADPSAASPVVGRLRLHQAVVRSEMRKGFAYVTVDRSDLQGWVDSAELTAHPPAAVSRRPAERPAPAAPARAPEAPEPVPGAALASATPEDSDAERPAEAPAAEAVTASVRALAPALAATAGENRAAVAPAASPAAAPSQQASAAPEPVAAAPTPEMLNPF